MATRSSGNGVAAASNAANPPCRKTNRTKRKFSIRDLILVFPNEPLKQKTTAFPNVAPTAAERTVNRGLRVLSRAPTVMPPRYNAGPNGTIFPMKLVANMTR